jgi:phosphoribosylglycinamide formyltransferase 2
VIYGQIEAAGIAFAGVDEALRIPGTDIRLFGKPQAFPRRRMGVALARADDIDLARQRARDAAARVRPVGPGA